MFVIKVQPVEGGWSVDTRDIVPMMFRSGGAAERAAHDLGRKLARTGAPVRAPLLGFELQT